MDIYDYLKRDHKKVANLFELFISATTERNKLEIIQMICKELLLHADAEANTFYLLLEKKCDDEKEILHGEEEHDKIKNKIKSILSEKNLSPALEKKLLELKSLVEHHVDEEEGKIFKIAKKVLDSDEAYNVKEKMHYLKWKIVNSVKLQEKEKIDDK